MLSRALKIIRDLAESGKVVLTDHADEELRNDALTSKDVRSIIRSGRIVERQFDTATSESKYLIQGSTKDADLAEIVCKIGVQQKVVIITIYRI